MNARDAVELLAGAVPARGGAWADLGAGEGLFTRALAARLGPGGVVYAVDRDTRALANLRRDAERDALAVTTVTGDFMADVALPDVREGELDGVLFANALHYVSDPAVVLARWVRWLCPIGRIVVVEYERRRANPWVPYPLPPQGLHDAALAAGLTPPVVTATRPSAFGGNLYVATIDRAER
jgi:ubiquinone/menaquinone biosynthesis C-methylase UbiE